MKNSFRVAPGIQLSSTKCNSSTEIMCLLLYVIRYFYLHINFRRPLGRVLISTSFMRHGAKLAEVIIGIVMIEAIEKVLMNKFKLDKSIDAIVMTLYQQTFKEI